MQFRTPVSIPSYPFHIRYSDTVLSMGSCFANQMGRRLQQRCFPVVHQPFGIVYNPATLQRGLEILASDHLYQSSDLVRRGEFWHSWDHHGSFSGLQEEAVLAHINAHLQTARASLSRISVLLLTLGTSYVYVHQEEGQVVANCHKFPATNFLRKRLAVEEVVLLLQKGIQALQRHAPNIRVLLTVSPIRHLRDGLIENQRSKAALLLAVEQLCQLDSVFYFPAYEILLDELRDYRFFGRDMAHPSEQATQYIWNRFTESLLEPDSYDIMKKVEKIRTSSQHRPLFPESEAHQQFLERLEKKKVDLMKRYPFLDLSDSLTSPSDP